MSKQRRYSRKQYQTTFRAPREAAAPAAPRSFEPKPPTQYGPAIIILEDAQKNTFEYTSGSWVPFEMSIAECRVECQVRALPQQVNGKTRYEIRRPLV